MNEIQLPEDRLFPLGAVVATPGALEALGDDDAERVQNANALLARHASGDWGEVCLEDQKENDFSVKERLRLLSVYKVKGTTVWLITEADRSSTTMLLPEEY